MVDAPHQSECQANSSDHDKEQDQRHEESSLGASQTTKKLDGENLGDGLDSKGVVSRSAGQRGESSQASQEN